MNCTSHKESFPIGINSSSLNKQNNVLYVPANKYIPMMYHTIKYKGTIYVHNYERVK